MINFTFQIEFVPELSVTLSYFPSFYFVVLKGNQNHNMVWKRTHIAESLIMVTDQATKIIKDLTD